MSAVIETIDLTLYGCPLHYIKARSALQRVALEQELLFIVNNGDAVNEVLNSLRGDGQICEISLVGSLTTTIKVTKRYDQNQ
jgi:TusA-related sulfurtransferase